MCHLERSIAITTTTCQVNAPQLHIYIYILINLHIIYWNTNLNQLAITEYRTFLDALINIWLSELDAAAGDEEDGDEEKEDEDEDEDDNLLPLK